MHKQLQRVFILILVCLPLFPLYASYEQLESRRKVVDKAWGEADSKISLLVERRKNAEIKFRTLTSAKWRVLWRARQANLDVANNRLMELNKELVSWRVRLNQKRRELEAERKALERAHPDKSAESYSAALDNYVLKFEQHLDVCELEFMSNYTDYITHVELYLVELEQGIAR